MILSRLRMCWLPNADHLPIENLWFKQYSGIIFVFQVNTKLTGLVHWVSQRQGRGLGFGSVFLKAKKEANLLLADIGTSNLDLAHPCFRIHAHTIFLQLFRHHVPWFIYDHWLENNSVNLKGINNILVLQLPWRLVVTKA